MNEVNDRPETEMAERARKLFRESVASLDGATRSRLQQARARAVEAAGRDGVRRWRPAGLVPLGVAAAAVVAAALVFTVSGSRGPDEPIVVDDLDLLLEGEALELFENLEFYAWLLEQPGMLEPDATGDGSG